ncbi:TVP38/TMEM64 family protein [Myxosarcina sp. GI1]|uniref:TVP38/TMEM64 family protein n=1 Tax=Myxosarcina sp. GI1 TaxID=1541065 RepID=UPI00068BD3AD|nr:TVP38/TMEM64 family protein [Myxosarcina sp. GI1]
MFSVGEWLTQSQDWLSSLGYGAYPAFIILYLLSTSIGLPTIFLFIGAGSLFGFIPGSLVVSVADTLSIAICYVLGRTIARKKVNQWISDRPEWKKFDRTVAEKGWKIVFLARLAPVLPSNLLNYGFSLTEINFWQYLLVSWLGTVPVIALYVYLASVGANLLSGNNDPRQIIFSIIGAIAAVAALIYTTKIIRNTFSKE